MLALTAPQRDFQNQVASLVAESISGLADVIEAESAFPQKAHLAFAGAGLYAAAMPSEFGGRNADATSLALMVETIAKESPSAALLVFPSNAVLRTVAATASPEQKRRILPELAAGDQPLAFCLTEPDHGSDAASLQTSAVRDGDHYIVNGSKSYITLGPHARYYLTFVRTGGEKAAGISCLLIPRDASGLSFGKAEKKMGLNASVTTQMFMDDCRVAAENLLWPENQGWRVLTEVCNPMRVWGAAAMACGNAAGAYNEALAYAKTTPQDERPLLHQQAVSFALAEARIQLEAARSLVYRVCAMLDEPGQAPAEVDQFVSMAKCFAADAGMRVSELASEIMGLDFTPNDNLASRHWRAAKAIQIFDGSNQVQRLIVGRGLGPA